MTFLQKIKLLVAHCAAGGGGDGKCSSLIRRRRRRWKKPHEFSKFRRMLHEADCSVDVDGRRNSEELKQRLVDLFFESEGGGGGGDEGGCSSGAERTRAEEGMSRSGRRGWRIGSSVGLRCRLLRRAWRPVLVAIPEND